MCCRPPAHTLGAMPSFQLASVQHTVSVQVGYLSKAVNVATLQHKDSIFVHVAGTMDWVCRAATNRGRSGSPLKDATQFPERLTGWPYSARGDDPCKDNKEDDLMDEFFQEKDCAGGQERGTRGQPETLKTSGRRSLSQAEHEFPTEIPLLDVVEDINIFRGEEKSRVTHGSLRCILRTNRRRSLY